MKVGVISDTHNFLDPGIPGLFAGVDHILHGGDIGSPKILLALEQIAPLTAVAGNTDDLSYSYPLTESVELGLTRFLLQHIVSPWSLSDCLRRRIVREQPRVVIFGHTHKPFSEEVDGVLFLNPGYAGKQRFNLPRSVAILTCDAASVRFEFVSLG